MRIENPPILVWYWDVLELAEIAKLERNQFEQENGFSLVSIIALYDEVDNTIKAVFRLCDQSLASIILILLHELAHAQQIGDEKEADDWALEKFRKLARSKKWQKTKIQLKVKRGSHQEAPDDRVTSNPIRLPSYQPDWVEQRYI